MELRLVPPPMRTTECAVRGDARDAIDRSTNRVRRVRDAEGGPRMSARSLIGDAVASGAQRAMHDALDAGAVQGDEGVGACCSVQQVSYAAQIARAFLAHRRGEQDRSPRFNPRPDERL